MKPRTSHLPTVANWFSPLGTCGCGKPAVGSLMNSRNDRLGYFCQRCADASIKLSAKLAEAAS